CLIKKCLYAKKGSGKIRNTYLIDPQTSSPLTRHVKPRINWARRARDAREPSLPRPEFVQFVQPREWLARDSRATRLAFAAIHFLSVFATITKGLAVSIWTVNHTKTGVPDPVFRHQVTWYKATSSYLWSKVRTKLVGILSCRNVE
ncbi:hypothetical protein NQ317_005908, partial [Molorchus minor]